jgi:hypothetical protein
MPIEYVELPQQETGSGQNSAGKLAWRIWGSYDRAAVQSQAESLAPSSLDGKPRTSVRVVEDPGGGVWLAEATYAPVEYTTQASGGSTFEFDTTGGTVHITHSKQTVTTSYGSGYSTSNTPAFANAIGVAEDGTIDGVDVTVPQFSFTVTHAFAKSSFTASYINTLYGLTGKVNDYDCTITVNGTSLTFDAGELLFLGARGGIRDASVAEVTYAFVASPNVTNQTVAGVTGINKNGHEYVWVYYKKAEDTGSKSLAPKPAAVLVERVYDSGNFASLNIP